MNKEIYDKLQSVLDEIYLLRNRVEGMHVQMEKQFRTLDARKIKRNRTLENRCIYFHPGKKRQCSGFISKSNSATLCYSHYCRANKIKSGPITGGLKEPLDVLGTLCDVSLDETAFFTMLHGQAPPPLPVRAIT